MDLTLASKIVNAYLQANTLPMQQIPALIVEVAQALKQVGTPAPQTVPPVPAVPVGRSVTADAVICLECGVRQKTLRRHLSAAHDLSPEQYRARWNLPSDYPLVAPDYAKRRSELALESGLGGRRAAETAETAAETKPGFRYPASRWSKPSE
jgi:Predicted transcriptional regulator